MFKGEYYRGALNPEGYRDSEQWITISCYFRKIQPNKICVQEWNEAGNTLAWHKIKIAMLFTAGWSVSQTEKGVKPMGERSIKIICVFEQPVKKGPARKSWENSREGSGCSSSFLSLPCNSPPWHGGTSPQPEKPLSCLNKWTESSVPGLGLTIESTKKTVFLLGMRGNESSHLSAP